jgi:hypothetical protein
MKLNELLQVENKHEKIDVHFKWDVSNLTTYQRYERALLCLKVYEREQRSIALTNFCQGDDFDNFDFTWEVFQSNELFATVVKKEEFIVYCLKEYNNPDGEEVNTTFYGRICNDMFNSLSTEQKNSVIERILAVDYFDFHTTDLDLINNSYYPSAVLEYMTDEQIDRLCDITIYPIHNDIVYTTRMTYTKKNGKRQYELKTVAN